MRTHNICFSVRTNKKSIYFGYSSCQDPAVAKPVFTSQTQVVTYESGLPVIRLVQL